MGFLMFTARVHDLARQRSDTQYKLLKISKKLRDLQQYAAMVGNGNISVGDLLSSPGSMMGRSMAYIGYAHNNALQYMQANAPMMQAMYQQQMGGAMQNPQQMQMMQNYIMRTLYIQGREQAAQEEQRNLKVEEGKLAQEKDTLQALLQEIDTELQEAKKARDEDIKLMAPKYTASA